jgi:16S rRNA (uracil1498-N3)-methyltransferase
MRNLFLPDADLTASTLIIEGADQHHLVNVLRVRLGEELVVLDNRGGAVRAEITTVEKRTLTVQTRGAAAVPAEPSCRITVAQALGKGDKFEQVIQHGTEIGAAAFLPLLTERTVVRLDAKEADGKRLRWQGIAKGAAEQSGRARIPVIEPVLTFRALVALFSEYDAVLLLHPGGVPLAAITLSAASVLLLVGPEGGFSPGEITAAEEGGAHITALTPYVLRTETAALVALSRLLA